MHVCAIVRRPLLLLIVFWLSMSLNILMQILNLVSTHQFQNWVSQSRPQRQCRLQVMLSPKCGHGDLLRDNFGDPTSQTKASIHPMTWDLRGMACEGWNELGSGGSRRKGDISSTSGRGLDVLCGMARAIDLAMFNTVDRDLRCNAYPLAIRADAATCERCSKRPERYIWERLFICI